MSATNKKEEKQPRTAKKKRGNAGSFKTYIHKILKEISPAAQISSDAVGQLDEFVKVVAKVLAESARAASINSGKSTVGKPEISLAINLHLPGDLAVKSLKMVNDACEKFSSRGDAGKKSGQRSMPVRREQQAGLVFSVALSEKFIREFDASDLNVSKMASVALAASLQNILETVLRNGFEVTSENKKVIMTIRHIFLGMSINPDITELRERMGIDFMGGGVIPYIHPELLPSKKKKAQQAARRRKNSKGKDKGGKKPHRHLPGTKALMEIKKNQKTTEPLLRKLPFERAVRSIANSVNSDYSLGLKDIHFGGGTIDALKAFVESRVVSLCTTAVSLAIHAKRDGVNGSDIDLAWKLTDPFVPFEDDVQMVEIGNNGIERLAFRGGVKRKGANMYQAVRCYMHSLVSRVLFYVLSIVKYQKVITVKISDLKGALSSHGIHFTIPPTLGKAKTRKVQQVEE